MVSCRRLKIGYREMFLSNKPIFNRRQVTNLPYMSSRLWTLAAK
jgi:hypothetical protein